MATIAGIPSTTKFSNIGGQIMVYLGGGSSRRPTSAELQAYNQNPKAFDVYGPGNRLLQTGTQQAASTAAKPATPTPVTATATKPATASSAPTVTPATTAPKPTTTPSTGMSALQPVGQPAAQTNEQRLAMLKSQLGQGSQAQQSATFQEYQRLDSQMRQAALQTPASPASMVIPQPAPQPAPVAAAPQPAPQPAPVAAAPQPAPMARPAATPVTQTSPGMTALAMPTTTPAPAAGPSTVPTTSTVPTPAPLPTPGFQPVNANAPLQPYTVSPTAQQSWYTSPLNPFNPIVPANYRTPASYATPVTVDIPRLNLQPFYFQNPATPFQPIVPQFTPATTPAVGTRPMMASGMLPQFDWGFMGGPRK